MKWIFLIVAGFIASGCVSETSTTSALSGGTGGTSPTPNSSSTPQNSGSVTIPSLPSGYSYSNFFMIATATSATTTTPNPPTFDAVLHAAASVTGSGAAYINPDWSQPCQITAGSQNTDLLCIYEIEEADLYLAGLDCYGNGANVVASNKPCAGNNLDDRIFLTYNIPSASSCPYFDFTPYYYWDKEPGIGPSQVTETINDTTTPPTVTWTDTSADGTNATVQSTTGLCIDGTQASPGTNVLGNCCAGSYTLTTITEATSGNTISTSTQSWGGTLSSCLGGVGANTTIWPHDSAPSTSSVYGGFPETVVTNSSLYSSSSFPYTSTFAFGGGGSLDMYSNIFSGNYFDIPALTAPSSYSTTAHWPTALQGPSGLLSLNPFYVATCRDHAGDILYRIRLLIRPWSSDSEFTSKTVAQWQATGVTPPNDPFDQNLNYEAWSNPGGSYPDFLTIFPGTSQ